MMEDIAKLGAKGLRALGLCLCKVPEVRRRLDHPLGLELLLNGGYCSSMRCLLLM